MFWTLAIYYLIGILQDFLLTLNWRYVAKDRPLPAVSYSFLTTVLSWLVFYNILADFNPQKNILEIIIYSLGVCTGTFLAMKLKLGSKNKN